MTEYRETGYGPDGYPPREGTDPGRGGPGAGPGGGTVYGGGPRHGQGEHAPSGPENRGYGASDSTYDAAALLRGRVWRPTRGPRAEGAAQAAGQGHAAPERGWRTSDGGYRTSDGGWRAPYRPYDTGEWSRDQHPDTGPASTGEMDRYSSGTGEIVRAQPPVPGEPTTYRSGGAEVGRYREPAPGYPGDAGPPGGPVGAPGSAAPRYPASGVPRPPASGAPRHPASAVPRYQDEVPRYQDRPDEPGRYPGGQGYLGGSGEIVPYRDAAPQAYRDGAAQAYRGAGDPRYPGPPVETGRDPRGSGEIERYPGAAGRRGTGEIARYSAAPGPRAPEMPGYPGGTGRAPNSGDARAYPTESTETTRIPRQPPPPGSPASSPKRDDSPELYTYDPLTLGGGESPAMRYDPATESYHEDPESPVPPSAVAGPRGGGPAGMYGAPRRPVEWAPPTGGQDIPARQRPMDRRYDDPPVRRQPARPQQRFEGTYPGRTARGPRNVAPTRGRPAVEEDEPDESPGYLHTALVTTAWYTIPLLLYTMYVLTLDGSASAGDGQSARENALNGLLGGMPRVGVALVTSLAVALLIRAIGKGWRAATIGFASAVVGAGAATVIFAALQG